MEAVKELGANMKTLVIAGDGRYYSPEAVQIVADVALANGVKNLWIGEQGIMSNFKQL